MKKGRLAKSEREEAILFGLVKLYLKSGQPIGSNTLKESEFDSLSSATIRNYFAKLEMGGYLEQVHSSGGRIPTPKALKAYALNMSETRALSDEEELILNAPFTSETKEVVALLHEAIDALSELTKTPVVISSPRFDQDQIQDVQLVKLDDRRLLAVIVTQFGLVHTETLIVQAPLSHHALKRIESHVRATFLNLEEFELDEEEEALAKHLTHELFLRHIARYAHFTSNDIYKTGFAKLLSYPELQDATALAGSLSLFESSHLMGQLLGDCMKSGELTLLIGEEDLAPYVTTPKTTAVIAIPYAIQGKIAGCIALLGPTRLDYPKHFSLLRAFSETLSQILTKSTSAFKITFRQPKQGFVDIKTDDKTVELYLEDQRP